MIAATAVGISHLVQSTRAGADYGLSMAWCILLIVLLKYPAFRFAADYASVTGKSLVHAYARQGRIALAWLVFAMLIEMFVGASAVSLVNAGVLISVFDLTVESSTGAIIVLLITAAVLINGRYTKAEKIVKFLVITFSMLVLLATIVAVPQLGSQGRELMANLSPDRQTIAFFVAMTGWMPLPVAVAAYHSIWIREKVAATDGIYTRSQAVFDLNVGWGLTFLLALCFLVIGAAALFQTGTLLPTSSPGFATLLFSVFTDLAGEWIYPLLAAAGLVVVWSTLIAIMDAVPRIMDHLYHEIRGDDDTAANYYRLFLTLQVLGCAIVLTVFLGDFASFIDVAASTAFITAPAIAYFNYRAVTSAEVSARYVPGRWLLVWNWLAILCFTVFAFLFLIFRFS